MVTDEWGFDVHEFSFTPGTTTYASTYNNVPTAPPVPGVNAPRGVHVAANGDIYVMDYWNQRVEYGSLGSSGQIAGAQAFGTRGDPNQSGAINFAWDFAIQPGRGTSSSPTGRATSSRSSARPAPRSGSTAAAAPPKPVHLPPGDRLRAERNALRRRFRQRPDPGVHGRHRHPRLRPLLRDQGHRLQAPAGELNMPSGIAVSPDGSTLWVADTLNNRIQSLSLTAGTWNAPIHKTTGKGKQTAFSVPWGVAVAPDGSIWVSDTGNHRLVSMSTAGALNWSMTGAQIGVPDNAQGNQTIYPFAVAFGSGDDVYLSDTWNNRVLVLTS